MDKLALATLLSWTGPLQGRKRLQKVVFLLHCAKFPTNAEFILHHYGPYSRDVAQTSDALVEINVIEESGGAPPIGNGFCYKLTDRGNQLLQNTQSPQIEEMLKFQSLANELVKENLWYLELGATIAFFMQEGEDVDNAVTLACKFKNVADGSDSVIEAKRIAEKIHSFQPV
ncbi:hypothetical protein [Rubinisphaera italica]|uniref:Antitoxin SocA-like Panacea domain-containing protein n=1 Tax=Rubinisphaera italica TaxID=2527969 RepID=A0A5C5XKS3_9PLAN|nr:hypothetical protein [Rubinisphaera italica]TWT63031.1 hypothetical protein Pan54_37820 [Rubinisphaera italica]